MKKVGLFVCIISTITLFAEPSFPDRFQKQWNAMEEFTQTHKELLNSGMRIGIGSLKILGALLTVKGYYHFLRDMQQHMQHHLKYNDVYPVTQQKIGPSLWNLWVHTEENIIINRNSNGDDLYKGKYLSTSCPYHTKQRISRPPYITALLIAIYLAATGSYEIYKEINRLIKEPKKKNSLLSETKNHLPKPDDSDDNFNRPRSHK